MFSNFRNLADIDDDGRLVLEEFQLAMHFVGVAKSGKPVPSSLPPEFIPPSYQKTATSSAGTAGRAASSGPKASTGAAAIPSIQPPAGGARKASGGVTAFVAPVAVSQTTAPVVSSAPKPSVDLLLLDDPFGAPPAELPVPLLEQGSASKTTAADEQKLTEDGATPSEAEFSCSVVWGAGAEIPVDETPNELESENPESEDLKHEVETKSSDALVPDATGVVEEEEEKPVDDADAIDNVKPMSVPELHITTVEDAPPSGRLI